MNTENQNQTENTTNMINNQAKSKRAFKMMPETKFRRKITTRTVQSIPANCKLKRWNGFKTGSTIRKIN